MSPALSPTSLCFCFFSPCKWFGGGSGAMESISVPVRHAIFPTNGRSLQNPRKQPSFVSIIPTTHKTGKFLIPYGGHRSPFCSIVNNYKQSDFQDFQGFAKPSRLLESTGLKACTDNSQQKCFTVSSVDSSQSLYRVRLQTSSAYGSSVSDQNAGILLCLIGASGGSILHRIPTILESDSVESMDMAEIAALHFQRGSIDEFTFYGPKLEKIEALWVSIESGQWRLGSVILLIVDACESSLERNDGEEIQYSGLLYDFDANDVLLGEGSDISMVELRPCLVSHLSGADTLTLSSKSPSWLSSLPGSTTSNEESMREYADLKLSLLLYDATLIIAGTTIANFSAGVNAAFAYFVGGIGGFLYLLLLQRSVDELPALPSISRNTNEVDRVIGGFKGPISSLAFAVAFISLAVKYGLGDVPQVLGPKEVLAGMLGFLACKVAVVLAAFKPVSQGSKENK